MAPHTGSDDCLKALVQAQPKYALSIWDGAAHGNSNVHKLLSISGSIGGVSAQTNWYKRQFVLQTAQRSQLVAQWAN
jgi:hypothetical protein